MLAAGHGHALGLGFWSVWFFFKYSKFWDHARMGTENGIIILTTYFLASRL